MDRRQRALALLRGKGLQAWALCLPGSARMKADLRGQKKAPRGRGSWSGLPRSSLWACRIWGFVPGGRLGRVLLEGMAHSSPRGPRHCSSDAARFLAMKGSQLTVASCPRCPRCLAPLHSLAPTSEQGSCRAAPSTARSRSPLGRNQKSSEAVEVQAPNPGLLLKAGCDRCCVHPGLYALAQLCSGFLKAATF